MFVVVWLERAEVPLLRDVLRAELDLHAGRRRDGSEVDDWEAEQQTLQDMLRSLDANHDRVEVSWPTEFAHGVFRRALLTATEHVGRCATPSNEQLSRARAVLAAVRATWQAFERVDWGEPR
jgi:hypothetical protein